MAGFQRANLLQRHAPMQQWNERVIDPMIRDEARIRTFNPDDIEERLRLLREYPVEMTETGDTFALVPQPQVPQWLTEVKPESNPWRTEVRPNHLRRYQR